MTSSVFPDVNVWLALSSPDHQHSPRAWSWYTELPDDAVLYFCRFTQLGLLRLLTTQAVMGPGTLSQAEAWAAFDRWMEEGGAAFALESPAIERPFRCRTPAEQASPKDWADAYLAAFAESAQFTLVTFDKALAKKSENTVLLGQA